MLRAPIWSTSAYSETIGTCSGAITSVTIANPVSARAESGKVSALLEQLRTLPVSRFVSDDPQADLEAFGLQASPQTPDLTLVFSNGVNRAAVLQIGASPTNEPDLAYARRQDPSNIVLVAREPFRAWLGDYTNFLDQHLVSLPPGWIESIETRGDDEFIVSRETNGQWEVHARQNFPASGRGSIAPARKRRFGRGNGIAKFLAS